MTNPYQNLKEIEFEKHIERELVNLHKYRKRNPEKDYDKETTFDKELLFEFLRSTQKEKIQKLEEIYGDAFESRVIRRIDEQIQTRGVIDILKKGVEEGPVKLDLMYFKPTTSLNPDIEKLFNQNIFSVIRQVKFSKTTDQSIDMVIFINGIPIFTLELKNELTGQNFNNAIYQYKTTRSPLEKIFKFGRCIGHFAVDTNEVYVTTELKEDRTIFLPFNKGYNNGAGNPPVDGKHKTYYLWENLFAPESLSDLISHYVHKYEEKRKDRLGNDYKKEVQIFPRYHQWETIINLLNDLKKRQDNKNYLIQHSAGSGKSLTIAWLAYRLMELHDDKNNKKFDTIIVLTDRKVLDQQLRNTVKALEPKPGLLISAGLDGTKLKDALESEAKIVTTTIQKFPFVIDLVKKLSQKKFALIVDEAHSSQSGELVKSVHDILGEETEDWLLNQFKSRKQPANILYFAFTATPKFETLERFGEKQQDGSFIPFSIYSMKQAIDEGFILDVLKNYTNYKTYFKLIKKVSEDPMMPRKKTLAAIFKYVNRHIKTLEQKIEIIMAHFETTVKHLINGEAKAMIVADSRESAVKYKLLLDDFLRENNYPYKTLVAFTGNINLDGFNYTESQMNNGLPEENTADEFKKPEYRFLIVAEKFQTGFDEPYLCGMYVDRRLISGVNAVQTLSRLNRTARDKNDVFILDFVNTAEEIKKAFEPYYITTIISEGSDLNTLNDLKTSLLKLYEIDNFTLDKFIEQIDPEKEEIHEKANTFLDNLVKNIIEELRDDLENDNKYKEFCYLVNQYVKNYPYFSQVLVISDLYFEKLYLLLKFLIKKLPKDPKNPPLQISKFIDMDTVRVVKKIKISIKLEDKVSEPLPPQSISPIFFNEDLEDPLSQIISDVNKKWGTDFGKDQQKTLDKISTELISNEEIKNVITNNVKQNAKIHFKEVYEEKIDDQFESDRKLWMKLRNNQELNNYIAERMFKFVADKIFSLRDE